MRNSHSLEKMCIPNRRRGLRLKNYRLLSRRNVDRRETVVGDFGSRINVIRPAWLQSPLQKAGDLPSLTTQGFTAQVDCVGKVHAALVF